MASETLRPCCEATLRDYRRRVENACTSYPVIKDIPCTVCRQVLKFRLYRPGGDDEDSPSTGV